MSETRKWYMPPPAIQEKDIVRIETADVVVVGLGYAGTAAVRAVAEEGASVLGIECRKEKGNVMFGSDIAQINSKFAKSRGVPEIDMIDFFNDWQIRSNNRANPRLLMEFCRKSGDNFDWMLEVCTQEEIDCIRIKHAIPPKYFNSDINGIRYWMGTAFIHERYGLSTTDVMRANLQRAKEYGARLFYEMAGQQLIKENGKVIGVVAKQADASYVRINAKKAVILAAGDFSGNAMMVHDLCTEMVSLADEGQILRGSGRDGSGIMMGIWAGGRMTPGPIAVMGGNYFYPNGIVGNTAALWLNDDGQRFCNEGFGGDMVFAALEGARLPGDKVTTIFDANILEHLEYQSIGHCSMDTSETSEIEAFSPVLLRKRLEMARTAGKNGYALTGHGFSNGKGNKVTIYATDTLEELAVRLGYAGENKENFIASVERYNKLCENKRDEDFGKDPSLLLPYNTPPYYGFQKEVYVGNEFLCTVDGLWTDDKQNVLDMSKKTIPGLYATGNCCGRRWGVQYSTSIGGLSIGMAWTLGREVGKNAVI